VVRRVLALTFLGLALVVCVALAATESLTNRTGRTATAVTVTFSEQVRLTSYDESVFPAKEPSSRASTFRFSGGDLANGARFSVSWTPSTAEITSTEWETTGASAAGSSAGSSTPLTYEQIMAQIAHYPGSDEPLCQPKEGEQIWLTDLEGHADIYDNDSIKINYASGFDKSQVTWIGVYRNGVKLRLPALFDVLTNAQMKTFDGNREEHTPKSSHTDHAIFGYEYEFRLTVGSAARALRAVVRSPIKANLTELWVELGAGWQSSLQWLSDGDLDQFFGTLRADGFTGVMLSFVTFVDSPTASSVWTLDSSDEAVAGWPSVWTQSPADFDRVLSATDRAGLSAHVHCLMSISRKYQSEYGVYSAHITPRDRSAFLESYLEIWKRYLPVFEKHHVQLVTPFAEMDGIISHTSEIALFHTQIAQGFSGRIGCELTTSSYLQGWSPQQNGRTFAQMSPDIWDWRDLQGRLLVNELDVWHAPLSPVKDQGMSALVVPFLDFMAPAIDLYRSQCPENPLMYGEFGGFPVDGYCTGTPPSEISPQTQDAQEMADLWAAFLIGVQMQGISSVTFWTIPIGDIPKDVMTASTFLNIDSGAYKVITSLGGVPTTP
jgi:hypothetical protein